MDKIEIKDLVPGVYYALWRNYYTHDDGTLEDWLFIVEVNGVAPLLGFAWVERMGHRDAHFTAYDSFRKAATAGRVDLYGPLPSPPQPGVYGPVRR